MTPSTRPGGGSPWLSGWWLSLFLILVVGLAGCSTGLFGGSTSLLARRTPSRSEGGMRPEVLADGVTAYIPVDVFSTGLETFGPLAKGLLHLGVALGILVAAALLAIPAVRMTSSWGWVRAGFWIGLLGVLLAEALVLPLFNAGLFDDGEALAVLGQCYAAALQRSGVAYDMLFGPAYKGIALASATAVELARRGRNIEFAYHRKEDKDHGEGGTLLGAPPRGRVVIVDDVISTGSSLVSVLRLLAGAGLRPQAAIVAMLQGERCKATLASSPFPDLHIYGAITTPLLVRGGDGFCRAE